MSNFEVSINRLLSSEGGYTSGQGDAGGETQWGISKRSYPNLNIKELTREQACALYKRDFWDRLHLDDQPMGVAYQLLDFAVNSGSGTATRALQRAVGCADDGVVGEHTLASIKATEPHDLLMRYLAQRLRFMRACKGWPLFNGGWVERICKNLEYAAEDV